MSLIVGTLEQLDLSIILRGLETSSKTGLLLVKQKAQWVEFYLRDGRLICIGPLRTNATLGERLVQAGVISLQAAQETIRHIGSEQPTEMRIALTLIDLGYVEREELRAWATQKALEVLRVVLAWSQGEIHFEEEALPPPGRLLVSLSIPLLLDSIPKPKPIDDEAVHDEQALEQEPVAAANDIASKPTLFTPAQFFSNTAQATSVEQHSTTGDYAPVLGLAPQPITPTIAQPVAALTPLPRRVDTSFMQPEMLLLSADLSTQRDQNRFVTLTPEQWRLLTCVDGHTSLQRACQELGMTPETVCQVTSELMSEGLIHVAYSAEAATSSTQSQSAPIPSSKSLYSSHHPTKPPYETQSQWGNGGSGAAFVPGRGWVIIKQRPVPLQPSSPIAAYNNAYAGVGG